MDIIDQLIGKLIYLPAIIVGLSFHEFAHAAVASKLGDPTAKSLGRVTINPLAHIDVLGFLALLLIGFGWGKPVPIDPRYFKHRRRDEILVSLSGVTMNLILAILFTGILKLLDQSANPFFATAPGGILIQMLVGCIWINLVLLIFNLIPIPPLDGFHVLAEVLNLRRTPLYYQIYEKGPFLLLLLIFFNLTDLILGPGVQFAYQILFNLFFS